MNNEIIESEYPPLQAIKLQPSTDLEIEASTYNRQYNKTPQDSKPSRKPKYKKLKKKDNVCWKCGRPGHYACLLYTSPSPRD